MEAAARTVLQDWNTGRISFYTIPPQRKSDDQLALPAAEIVSQWGKDFDLSSIVQLEQAVVLDKMTTLPSVLAARMVSRHTHNHQLTILVVVVVVVDRPLFFYYLIAMIILAQSARSLLVIR